MGTRTPPLLCVYCGAEARAREPCPRCKRPLASGQWVEVEPLPYERARALRMLVFLVVPWLLPVTWILGTAMIVLAAAGVTLPQSIAPGVSEARGPILILVLVLPVMAYLLAAVLRELTLDTLGELLDTQWRFAPVRPGLAVHATTRRGRFRGADGSVTICEGAPIGGAEVSSRGVTDAGLAEIAIALGEHPRDVLVMAAFAGMIARGEVEVRASRRIRWRHGEPAMPESPGWDIRLVALDEPSGVVERAIAAAVPTSSRGVAQVAVPPASSGYRSSTAVAPELGSTSLHDVWNPAYAAADEASKPSGSGEPRALTEQLRAWIGAEPAFHRALADLGTSHRSD